MTNTRHPQETREALWTSTDAVHLGTTPELFDPKRPAPPLLTKSIVLGQTLEKEVIPRLVLTYGPKPHSKRVLSSDTGSSRFETRDIAHMAELVVQKDNRAAMAFIKKIKTEGASIESIYVDLLAPTARYLGEMWKGDQCNFTEVTVGTSRLQQILLALSPEFEREKNQTFEEHRILFSPMPGEQHTFGLMLVEEYFRRAGWYCCKCAPREIDDLLHLVRSLFFDVVALSAGCEGSLKEMTKVIETLRKISLNSKVFIMVGGPIFREASHLATEYKADGTASDGHEAIQKMQQHFGARGQCL